MAGALNLMERDQPLHGRLFVCLFVDFGETVRAQDGGTSCFASMSSVRWL